MQIIDCVLVGGVVDDVQMLSLPIQLSVVAPVVVKLSSDDVIDVGDDVDLVKSEPASVAPLIRSHRVPHDLRLVAERLRPHDSGIGTGGLGELRECRRLESGVICLGRVKDGRERGAVDVLTVHDRVRKPHQLCDRPVEVYRLREHPRHPARARSVLPWRPDDQRRPERHLEVRHLRPGVVLAKLPTMVAEGHDQRRARHLQVFELGEEAPDVIVGVGDRGVVRAPKDGRASQVARPVVRDPHAVHVRRVVPGNFRHSLGCEHVVGQGNVAQVYGEVLVELVRVLPRNVWLMEAATDEESPVARAVGALDGRGRPLELVHAAVTDPLVLELVVKARLVHRRVRRAGSRPLAIVQAGGVVARRVLREAVEHAAGVVRNLLVASRSGGVQADIPVLGVVGHALRTVICPAKLCRPRSRIVVVRRDHRMEELAAAGGEIPVRLEVLRKRAPPGADAVLTEMVHKVPDTSGVRAATGHERIAAWGAECILDVGPLECQAAVRQLVHVWRVGEGEVERANGGPHVVDNEE
mmetsp:Transcript_23056/g.49765  ORF Transcript_23056/g.49765 Transcript_23056/m.49765 type:complete len:525 (-) Transcript_23056:101-1675(-)